MLESLAILTYLFSHPSASTRATSDFVLTSPAFADHGVIPQLYTCWGQQVSPPLVWTGSPPGTRSFVLLVIDQDVPRFQWYQWALFNIPAEQHYLARNALFRQSLSQANNSFGTPSYHSFCPLAGIHHYKIELYALDTQLAPSSEQDPIILRKNMQNHILGIATLEGEVKTPRHRHSHGAHSPGTRLTLHHLLFR